MGLYKKSAWCFLPLEHMIKKKKKAHKIITMTVILHNAMKIGTEQLKPIKRLCKKTVHTEMLGLIFLSAHIN